MVLLIKNKLASFEDVAHLPVSAAGGAHSGRLAKSSTQSLRNAGVPKAKSLPHINLLAEGGSLKAHCTAVLNADLHKLKPRELIVRKVKSAKEDLRQLFDSVSLKRVEPIKGPSDSISKESASPTTASNVGASSSLDSPCSLAASVPAPSDEQGEDVEDHIHRLTAAAQSWLDFERLFSNRRALSDPTIDEARHDFCQALAQLFSHRSPTASPLQVPQPSSDLADSPSFHPICSSPGCSPTPSATAWTNQTTVTFDLIEPTAQEKLSQSPEFSDEDLQREFDNFSFHSSQEEEWTSEVESRKQNEINRVLSDMKRELAVPIPRLSSYFSDDSLADSAAHQTLVNPRPTSPEVFFQKDDDSSSYSADREDDDDKSFSLSVTPPDSPACTARQVVDAVIIPTSPAEVSLSGQMDDPTSDEEQDDPEPRVEDIENGAEDVWEVLATYVPRLLSRISEESLADEYEIEATAPPPPPSFRRPTSQYRKFLWSRRQCTSPLDHTDQVDSGVASSSAGTPFVTTMDIENGPSSSSMVNSGRTLRRVRKFVDLKNPVVPPTVQSTSSIETICETISLHEEGCPPEPLFRRLRRAPGCLNLRKAFGGTDKTPPSFEEQQRSPDLEEGHEVPPVFPRPALTRKNSTKPPIPPKPSGLHLHRKKTQLPFADIQEPSSLCSSCDPSSSLPLWSCAKITRSKGKRGRPLGESTRALKKRIDCIRIDPETIHGHPPLRRREELPSIPSIGESRKHKTSKNIGKLEKTRSKAAAVQDVEKQKIFKNKNTIFALRPLPCKDEIVVLVEMESTVTLDVP